MNRRSVMLTKFNQIWQCLHKRLIEREKS